MTLQQLIYAQALLKAGNYGRAAKAVGISQPALSLQIKKLEDQIGFHLVDRSKKKVAITEKGSLFLDRAQLLINEHQQLENLTKKLRDNHSGELRIGIIPTLAPYLLPLFINQLNEQYRDLTIHIKEALTEEIIQDLKAGNLDGGIISTPISSGVSFAIHPLFYEPFMLFVSSEHPLYQQTDISVKDIPFADVWLLKEGNCFRDQVNNICEIAQLQDRHGAFQFESNSIESLCRIVEFKGGITFLPELTTMHISEEREDMIKPISGIKRVREISLLYLPNHIYKKDMDLFANIVKTNLPKHLLRRGKAVPIPTNVEID